MARRLALVLAVVLALAAPASGGLGDRKQSVDSHIARLHEKIGQAHEREAALSAEIASVTVQIRKLEGQVGDVSRRLNTLEDDLRLHQERLAKLTELFQLQARRLSFLRRQYAAAVDRLNQRLVDLYESDDTSALAVALSARSFSDLLDGLDYVRQIGLEDKRIAAEVGRAKAQAQIARDKTQKTRAGVQAVTQVIAVRMSQVRDFRNELLASKSKLSGARSQKTHALASVQVSEREFVDEVDALAKVSAALAARIKAAQRAAGSSPASSGDGSTPSASGLVWPVDGTVTSPFGWRWGRLHEGIDIAAPVGAPIRAAAAGTVIYAGWMEGYGNLTVIDHGNGLATAYAHQSSIGVANGQQVTQGETIGAVGSTGESTGPHLHLEVRVNGSPVDPLGYL